MTAERFEELLTDVKAFCKWVDAERREDEEKARAAARGKNEKEQNLARSLAAEATALTKNLKRYF